MRDSLLLRNRFVPLAALLAQLAVGQTLPERLKPLLEKQLQSPDVVTSELRHYLIAKRPKWPTPETRDAWTKESESIRRRMLETLLHGWPKEWVDAPLKMEDLGLITAGPGYRIRKLRYEVVPGFYSPALLYEPELMRGKMPAIINVNGHNEPGKALEWKQKRCINQALRGIISLNLEWIGFGELRTSENAHWFSAHLELTGANAAGIFYLQMRKGLDYLWDHPNVDRARIGMTGLSGGGSQTIVLSGLDPRIRVAVPVAGDSGIESRIERASDVGDPEQNPSDMLTVADYTTYGAMRAPRPTLLIYNAEDDCCFRAGMVRPYVYDQVLPIFRLFGAEGKFRWYLNTDPGDHNYQIDNRQQSYRFFAEQFGLQEPGKEIPVDPQVKTPEELMVGLPPNNLTLLRLAKKMAADIHYAAPPARGDKAAWRGDERTKLRTTLRYYPVSVERAWPVTNTYGKGIETFSYILDFSNRLSANVLTLSSLPARDGRIATIVLNDKGKKESGIPASEGVNRGDLVLALDVLGTGEGAPKPPAYNRFAQMLATTGDRPLGMEAAQLIAVARWARQRFNVIAIRLETYGIRSQVIGQVTSAMEPDLLTQVIIRNGMLSLHHLLDAPVEYQDAPDLFCLDLLRNFDLTELKDLATPTLIRSAAIER